MQQYNHKSPPKQTINFHHSINNCLNQSKTRHIASFRRHSSEISLPITKNINNISFVANPLSRKKFCCSYSSDNVLSLGNVAIILDVGLKLHCFYFQKIDMEYLEAQKVFENNNFGRFITICIDKK